MNCIADRGGHPSTCAGFPDVRRGNRRPFWFPAGKLQWPFLLRVLPPLAAGIVATLLLPSVALAIGSNDQKITITAGLPGPLNVSGVLSAGLNGMNMPNIPVGTGTIIGFKEVGNTGYVAILTANHVATAGVTTMSLGAGPGSYESVSL